MHEYTAVNVKVDAGIVKGLDEWRQDCPSVNRSALVNQILQDWILKNPSAHQRYVMSRRGVKA